MFFDLQLTPAQQTLLALWLAAFGGCIGSFMNVVVYRLPRGKSLVYPGSACPACGHAIRWQHNIPVVGWLLLRGRCRDCGVKISARYPTVEAIVAGAFVLVGWLGPLSGGENLPYFWRLDPAGGMFWGMYAWHMLLLCVLFCSALIEYDGDVRYPWRLFALPMLGGLLALAIWPSLQPVPSGLELSADWRGAVEGLIGAAAGFAAGLLAIVVAEVARLSAARSGEPSSAGAFNHTRQRCLLSTLDSRLSTLSAFRAPLHAALVGLFLGWRAALVLAVAATVVYLPIRFTTRRAPWSLVLCGATLLWIVGWRWIVETFPALG